MILHYIADKKIDKSDPWTKKHLPEERKKQKKTESSPEEKKSFLDLLMASDSVINPSLRGKRGKGRGRGRRK